MEIRHVGGEAPGGPAGNQHIVGKGETLDQIAKQYGVTTDSLLLANPQLKDPSKLLPGQSLQIPQQSESAEKLASNLYPSIGFPSQDVIEQAPQNFAVGPPCSQPNKGERGICISFQPAGAGVDASCITYQPAGVIEPCDFVADAGIVTPNCLQAASGLDKPLFANNFKLELGRIASFAGHLLIQDLALSNRFKLTIGR